MEVTDLVGNLLCRGLHGPRSPTLTFRRKQGRKPCYQVTTRVETQALDHGNWPRPKRAIKYFPESCRSWAIWQGCGITTLIPAFTKPTRVRACSTFLLTTLQLFTGVPSYSVQPGEFVSPGKRGRCLQAFESQLRSSSTDHIASFNRRYGIG